MIRPTGYGLGGQIVTTSPEQDVEDSQLLQRLLLLSAGLGRLRSRAEITSVYPKAAQFRSDYRTLDRHLLVPNGTVEIFGRDRLVGLLSRYRPADLVIATAHHGHFVAFFSACARAGIPLAACYRSASEPYLDSLRQSGVALVDLDAMRSVAHIFDAFDRLRTEGRYLALMIDAPFASRRYYHFLRYRVSVSSMPWLYARRCGASLLPLVSNMISSDLLGYVAGEAMEDLGSDRTQDLLRFLEEVILDQSEQYAWTTSSILLSDPAAREDALSFVIDALGWRDANRHRT
jgi:lauroyl/myristoyl acyltransferase